MNYSLDYYISIYKEKSVKTIVEVNGIEYDEFCSDDTDNDSNYDTVHILLSEDIRDIIPYLYYKQFGKYYNELSLLVQQNSASENLFDD